MSERILLWWQQLAVLNGKRFAKHAHKSGELVNPIDELRFHVMALCGEVGEIANIVKKEWRGDEMDNNTLKEKLADEKADVRTYLFRIEMLMGIDLDQACEKKVQEVARRLDNRGL